MDGDRVGAGFGELFQIRVHRRDHQVDVEGLCSVPPQRLHHRRSDGEIGDEMAVHDIDVDPVGAGFVDRAHLFAETREIGREDRRGDADALLHDGRI